MSAKIIEFKEQEADICVCNHCDGEILTTSCDDHLDYCVECRTVEGETRYITQKEWENL